MRVCRLKYPACNAYALYCHLWPVWLCSIFPHYLINGSIFEKKKVIELRGCVLIFSTTFVRNISHSNKNWARYDQKYILVSIQRTRYSWQILMETEFSQFSKNTIKFYGNPSSRSRAVPCGRTDRQIDSQTYRYDEANNRFLTVLWTRLKKSLHMGDQSDTLQ